MQGFESVRWTVRRPLFEVSGNHRTDDRTAAGQLAIYANENKDLQLSGGLSGAVRTPVLAAVCPVGVSIRHPTPDTRTTSRHKLWKGA
jgi:hypothetical protein